MAQDYKNVRANKKSSCTLPFLSGLAIGLLVAVLVFVYKEGNLFVSDALMPDKQDDTPVASDETTAPAETDPVPTPEFEFYKILPNKEINISELLAEDETAVPKADAETAADTPVLADGDIYMFQVGSFKRRKSAEIVKARLALLGLRAEIRETVIRGRDVRYRVRLGPYTSIKELKATRQMLYENKFDHIEKRLQAE
ncbi:MAG: SPOR domain-containing protein [Gammaproteobacteria bacterium]